MAQFYYPNIYAQSFAKASSRLNKKDAAILVVPYGSTCIGIFEKHNIDSKEVK